MKKIFVVSNVITGKPVKVFTLEGIANLWKARQANKDNYIVTPLELNNPSSEA